MSSADTATAHPTRTTSTNDHETSLSALNTTGNTTKPETSTTTTSGVTTTTDVSTTTTNALDLSWLSESVLEAALETKDLKYHDVQQFHDSLRVAEDVGCMDHDVSERLHTRCEERKSQLLSKLVSHEAARVSQRLGLYPILKAYKIWTQVSFMAGVTMNEFDGLHEQDNMVPAFQTFHSVLQKEANQNESSKLFKLPFSKAGETNDYEEQNQVREDLEKQVNEKICQEYKKLYDTMVDPESGGYSEAFINNETMRQYSPNKLADMVNVYLE